MRFRTHLLSSLALGLALYPRRPARLAALVAAGTLVDFDHLVMYGLRTGDWSVVGALRYERYRHRGMGAGDNRPRYGSLRSWLHQPPLVLGAAWAGAARERRLWPVAIGLSLHLLLDFVDWPNHYRAKLRARGVCQTCGRRGMRLHATRQGRWGDYSYRVLCVTCLERAARGLPPGPPGRGRRGRSAGRPVVH